MRSFDTNPWNNLSASEFEEFCFTILRLQGFQDLEWFGAGGADKGRDLVGSKFERPLGRSVSRKWVIQCKHYKSARLTKTQSSLIGWLLQGSMSLTELY